jgi:hypothetical protein
LSNLRSAYFCRLSRCLSCGVPITAAGESPGAAQLIPDIVDELVSELARHFSRPRLKITVNPKTKLIERVDVVRNSACGSVSHVARGLIGVSADEADPKAGLILHHYPCLCSMNQEQIDERL